MTLDVRGLLAGWHSAEGPLRIVEEGIAPGWDAGGGCLDQGDGGREHAGRQSPDP